MRLYCPKLKDDSTITNTRVVPVFAGTLLLAGMLQMAAPTAGAGVIGVRYSGLVNYLDNASAGFPIPVALNDPFVLTFYFETTIADSLPNDPTNGRYENAITRWSMQVGNQVYSAVAARNGVVHAFGNVITVTRGGMIPNYPWSGHAYQIGASAFMFGGVSTSAGAAFIPPAFGTSPTFASDAMIAGPVNPSGWPNPQLGISFWDAQAGGRTIFGSLQTGELVPIPAAVWLLGSALGVLVWFRRSASSHGAL